MNFKHLFIIDAGKYGRPNFERYINRNVDKYLYRIPVIQHPRINFEYLESSRFSTNDNNKIIDKITSLAEPVVCILQGAECNFLSGDTPQQIADVYQKFTEEIFNQNPNVHIIIMGLEPAIPEHTVEQEMRDKCDQQVCEMTYRFTNKKLNFVKAIPPSESICGIKGPYQVTEEGVIQIIQIFNNYFEDLY